LTETFLSQALCAQALPALAARGIAVPAYARGGLVPGVVHLGLGAFHRAHQALVFDYLLGQGDARWGVLGVSMRNPEVADTLASQEGLYAVQVASHAGIRWQVAGAVVKTAVAARDRAAVVEAMAAPSTRWVTLTVTEKGYGPELAQLLVDGLAQRHAGGLAGLTVASCDNLSDNGRQLEALCMAEAAQRSPVLAAWLQSACAFPNSMVDRIVPAATPERRAAALQALGVHDAAALGTEAFWEWVIEDRFVDANDGAALASAGVTVVRDVRPFEEAKLRMLNGSHTAIACIGAVARLGTVAGTVGQAAVRALVHGHMTHEVMPHLQRSDGAAYRDALLARFVNPELKHSVHQIASDNSKKIPLRWPPTLLAQQQAGRPSPRLAFAAAAWMRYCRGVDEQGEAYVLSDPMGETLQALARQHAGNADATVQALGTLPAIWGAELPLNTAWLAEVSGHLQAIERLGVLTAAEALCASLPAD
jgi:fructuronate reductase